MESEAMNAEYQVQTPVAFLVFNRPDTTARVFVEIARVKPRRLLVVADGPRSDREGESDRCAAARSIVEQVDWDCQILRNYSEVNLGCKRRVSSGLDWVFDTVDRAIVLEDDCLPHPTFFRFCDELLEKYQEDERVGAISGCNFQNGCTRSRYSYYFSRYNHVWGWASWARAWKFYDVDMRLWPVIREEHYLSGLISDAMTQDYWTKTFQTVYEGGIDTWDYQWTFACWVNSMLSVLPQVNLVSNIGFGSEAVHTTRYDTKVAEKPTECMTFPLFHPDFVIRHDEADAYTDDQFGWPRQSAILHRWNYCYYFLDKMSAKIRHLAYLVRDREFRMAAAEVRRGLLLVAQNLKSIYKGSRL